MNFAKFENIVDQGREICFKDNNQCNNERDRYYHIAYLVKGKRIITYSRNHYNRQYVNGKVMTSLHAEIGCMLKYKNSSRIRKGFDILILRYNRHTGCLCDSKPCNNCKQFLIKKGINRIYCSLSDGSIKKIRLEDIEEYYSVAWKKLIGERPLIL